MWLRCNSHTTIRVCLLTAGTNECGALGGTTAGLNEGIAARGRKLELAVTHAHSAGARHRRLTAVDRAGCPRAARAAAAAGRAGLPRRLVVRAGGADGALRRGLRRARRYAQFATEVGVLAAGGPRVRADPVRHLPVGDPPSAHRVAGLDAVV